MPEPYLIGQSVATRQLPELGRLARMHRVPNDTPKRPISLADVISERGTSAAVLERISELRSAGMIAPARAIERELTQLGLV